MIRNTGFGLACIAIVGFAPFSFGNDYYISLTGSDSGAGTSSQPFATFTKAINTASAGDTIYVRGGTYNLSSTLTISKAGTAASPYKIFAYPNETPVLDFSGTDSGDRGIQIDSNYWHLRGLTVQNARDNGIHITGSNNTIERVVLHGNQDSGLQISGTSTRHPSNNLILNSDSYGNYDPANNGENADGFAAKFRDIGTNNVFRGVRAWGNSDDGWDFWAAANGVTVENSWSFKNGFNMFGDSNFAGDGNGLKLGHDSGTHVLKNLLVWGNKANGIDINGNATVDTSVVSPYVAITHGVQVLNVTAYNNGAKNFLFDESFAHVLRNNISLLSGSSNTFASGLVSDHNSWTTAALLAEIADFLSVDDTGATGPRQADGSLPFLDFLRLTAGSNLIDAGANVGTSYNGSSPDLGALEFGLVPEPSSLLLGVAGTALLLRRTRPTSNDRR